MIHYGRWAAECRHERARARPSPTTTTAAVVGVGKVTWHAGVSPLRGRELGRLYACWCAAGPLLASIRCVPARERRARSSHRARTVIVHGMCTATTQAAHGDSLPCSLGSVPDPHGCPVPWVLPPDHAEQGWTTGGKSGRLCGLPRIAKIEFRKTTIFFR